MRAPPRLKQVARLGTTSFSYAGDFARPSVSVRGAADATYERAAAAAGVSNRCPAILGLHLRGTDVFNPRIYPKDYWPLADEWLRTHRGVIYLATDDASYAKEVRARYGTFRRVSEKPSN